MPRRIASLSLVAFALGCSTPPQQKPPTTCSVATQSGCGSDLVCEDVMGGDPTCFSPLTVTGTITDIATKKPVANARVVALDASGQAFSVASLSSVDGTYHLSVPAPRADKSGTLRPLTFSLRVDAEGYQPFAMAPRAAPVLDVKDAKGPPYVIQTPSTDVALLHLTNTMGFGSLSGTVTGDTPASGGAPGGALIVTATSTGVADRHGNFVVFNVPAGQTKVQAYKQGFDFDVSSATVNPYQESKGIALPANAAPPVNVTGTLQLTNAGAAKSTSVCLVVEDTFDATLSRGVSPPGLCAANVSGDFTITGVPSGAYVVLPGLDDDGVVRVADTTVMGAPIIHISVGSTDVKVPQPLKVTGAMAVVGLGANGVDGVSGTPTLSWQPDPNADSYRVEVFDAFSMSVWSTTGSFSAGAGQPESLPYGGPALQSGMIYQFRATSLKGGTPLTSTEDLAGGFLYQ